MPAVTLDGLGQVPSRRYVEMPVAYYRRQVDSAFRRELPPAELAPIIEPVLGRLSAAFSRRNWRLYGELSEVVTLWLQAMGVAERRSGRKATESAVRRAAARISRALARS